jgi:hypothetical protein
MADGGGVTLRYPRDSRRPTQLRFRETPPPTRFAGHLLPQAEEAAPMTILNVGRP